MPNKRSGFDRLMTILMLLLFIVVVTLIFVTGRATGAVEMIFPQ